MSPPGTRETAGRSRLGRGLLLLALVVGCQLLAERDLAPLTEAERAWRHTEGELLLARSQCTACHAADEATLERLQPLPAPDLAGIGERVTPGWLAAWLDHGHRMRPGTRMPDVLHDLDDPQDRAEVIDELVHFLVVQGEPYRAPPTRADSWDMARGQELFGTLGCRACHPEGVDGELAAKTDRERLAAFLLDPLVHRPSGLMPDMQLSDDEADALASWLLREQQARGPTAVDWAPGLELTTYEIPTWPEELPDWDELTPAAVYSVTTIDTEHEPREDEFGLVFRGELFVEEDGEHTFYVRSDDGSRLWIDGEVVIDHDGNHGATRRDGSVTLEAGWHPVVVEMYEAGGDQAIEAGWVDAEDRRQPFVAGELRHRLTRFDPVGHEPGAAAGGWKAWWGGIRFKMRRCGACHEVEGVGRRGAGDLDSLQELTAGCLAEEVPGRLPDYRFTEAERAALRETLANRRSLRAPLPPEQVVDHALRRLDCLACHTRGGEGGPDGAVRAAFTSDADLGDEGRLPPTLDGVGARLRPRWLASVLEDGASVRPYMHARMPRFGERAVAPLVQALPLADPPLAGPPPPVSDARLVAAGRDLAGQGAGLDCIGCHSVAGQEGVGLPGLDLATTAGRMTWSAFRHWLLDPIAARPGTRMPTYFDGGRSVQPAVLEGDAESQIAALWSWLSMASALPLPPGLVVDRSAYDQLPVDRPLVLSVFMDDISPRVLAVGYPERVAAAFDADNVRLALLWRGDFLNVEGTWRGRAGELELPAGERVIDLPPGPALAPADEPWPAAVGREAGWRMIGQRRDALGLPGFRYAHVGHGVEVEERLRPVLDPADARFVRSLLVRGPGAGRLSLRAATDATIRAEGNRSYRCADGRTVVVRAGTGRLRSTEQGVELLVSPEVADSDTVLLEVELVW